MSKFKNVRDDALLLRTKKLARMNHRITAELLEHLGEIESRRLHLKLGYDSMMAYCMAELDFSESAARRRVHAANVARQFPALFASVANGRVHLSAILQVAAYLTPGNVEDVVAAIARKGRSQIDLELARMFPQVEALRLDDGIAPQVVVPQQASAQPCAPARTVIDPVEQSEPRPAPSRLMPITAKRYTLQVTIDAQTHDELRELQELLGQSAVADVLKECVHMRLAEVKKRKFAQVQRPRQSPGTRRPRGISAQVKRAVHARDGERCAYVGENGHRCNSRKQLEYDHIIPVALGGKSTVENVRLVCRIHNQFAADQVFGRDHMDRFRTPAAVRAAEHDEVPDDPEHASGWSESDLGVFEGPDVTQGWPSKAVGPAGETLAGG